MSEIKQNVLEEFRELEEIHKKLLHELADAAQIIKSYEYLEKRHKKEQKLVEDILQNADELCDVRDFQSFKEKRRDLIRAVRTYRTSGRNGNGTPESHHQTPSSPDSPLSKS